MIRHLKKYFIEGKKFSNCTNMCDSFISGIFVSRLSDSLPASFFASLMGVGDEILEINQQKVRNLAMEHIHNMIASNNRLILKTLPFLSRQDV